MSSRVKMHIKDLGKVITGHTPPTKERRFYGDKYVFIKPTDIDENSRFVQQVEEKLSDEGYNKFKNAILPPMTPCMVTIGSLGKKMCITNDWSFTNQAINALLVNEKHNSMYVYYLFRTLLPTVKFLSNGTASGRENVSKSSFEQIEISIPNRIEQDKIAFFLSSYDDLIENNNRRIAILEEMVQRLYREWFVHFRFPGHEIVNMVESELGMIPEGWNVIRIENCCSILRRGISPEYNDNAVGIVINQKCIRDFSVNLQLARNQEKAFSSELQVQSGDVLINSTGVGTLGRVAQIYEHPQNCTVDSHVTLLRPHTDIAYYIGSYFRERQEAIMDMGVGSTGQTELSRDKIKEMQIIIPDEHITNKYEAYISKLMTLKTKLQKTTLSLQKNRDLLLPRLISGDIDVSGIDIQVSNAN
jgi:type I restriction enzyme S subunit